MRFLCLHGRGTNSDIFESQLGPGITDLYPPPFLCWYEHGVPVEVQDALVDLAVIIDEDGPYDGVVGFSEGAAVVASLLLSENNSSRDNENRFHVAVLFNSVIPLIPEKTVQKIPGEPLGEVVSGQDHESYLALLKQTSSSTKARWYTPRASSARISIPTVHVIGARDPFAASSRMVVDLYQPEKTHVLVHEGGHTLPQTAAGLDRCAEMIETAVMLASLDGL
ncbi:hypothetical protein ASPZODRAFT_16182 [Penicilliopsis zonata CBS 506.65]|uniref:Serine hydrolase domain-containing protein n=1 Tax=Penicilliopsis zonata CBS 506.65 TaxID=1073090 RepID=A0A1L9SGL9_9EURO|nr:hypothetical protein ASPZODRAFT_16182 [Penicilliopsis zonata CBS 506.65]OJJ46415.1 hypothetical protein ASPZODRAFT_16182 [Penicilliopsis zonata CBS 506.65]